jgi:hypothetical protein
LMKGSDWLYQDATPVRPGEDIFGRTGCFSAGTRICGAGDRVYCRLEIGSAETRGTDTIIRVISDLLTPGITKSFLSGNPASRTRNARVVGTVALRLPISPSPSEDALLDTRRGICPYLNTSM